LALPAKGIPTQGASPSRYLNESRERRIKTPFAMV
jgi:hypothetical protein